MTHWKRLWCWERLKAGGEGDGGGWDGWMASLTQWTWVSGNSRSWWWTGKPGVLQSMGSQRVRQDWARELTNQEGPFLDIMSQVRRKVQIGNLMPHLSNKEGKRENLQAFHVHGLYSIKVVSIGDHLKVLILHHPIEYVISTKVWQAIGITLKYSDEEHTNDPCLYSSQTRSSNLRAITWRGLWNVRWQLENTKL